MQARALDMSALEELDDRTLAQQAPGDFEAFAELYRRYLCPVYRFVRSQTTDEPTAEDITAHIFFKALSSAGTFRGEGSYSAWLFRIAHNSLASWRQRLAHSAVVTQDVPDREDPTPSPPSQVITNEARDLVWGTVAGLPPTQREVVALRYIQDFSIEEVADITGRSRGAVRILLHRARARLRKALDGKDIA